MKRFVAAALTLCFSSFGCQLVRATADGVGTEVVPSRTLQNLGMPQHSILVVGFIEKDARDLAFDSVVVATTPEGNPVSSVSVGLQGYYTLFLPPGDYVINVFVDRNADGRVDRGEWAGQVRELITVRLAEEVAYFGLDIEARESEASKAPFPKAVAQDITIESAPSLQATGDLQAEVYGKTNASRGVYDANTEFFDHVSPIQHLDALDLTTARIPVVFVHGIEDSPQIFEDLERRLPKNRYQSLFFYYPTGARLPAMAQLLHYLFFSGQVLPTFERSAVLAHSMGGLVAWGSLDRARGLAGESRVDFFGSFVTPYGGIPMAEMGIKTGPVVIPSWIDISPDSQYLADLKKGPLPENTTFCMVNANGSGDSDGVVLLSSQRRASVLKEAKHDRIFPDSHVGIMSNDDALGTMLGWMDDALSSPAWAPHGEHGPALAEDEAGLSDGEKHARALTLRRALHNELQRKKIEVWWSPIAPTVLRLKLRKGNKQTVIQVSVGEKLRLDAPGEHRPLGIWPFSSDQVAEHLAQQVAGSIVARLGAAPVATPPTIPAGLTKNAPAADLIDESVEENPMVILPPPIVFGTGASVSMDIKPFAPRVQMFWKLDGYLGNFGLGLDIRRALISGIAEFEDANMIFQPWVFAAGPRFRLGRATSLVSLSGGVSAGVEWGRALFLRPSSSRFSFDSEDVIGVDWLTRSLVYTTAGAALRLHQNFYAIGQGEGGVRFPQREVALDGGKTVSFEPSVFINLLLGVEVRGP